MSSAHTVLRIVASLATAVKLLTVSQHARYSAMLCYRRLHFPVGKLRFSDPRNSKPLDLHLWNVNKRLCPRDHLYNLPSFIEIRLLEAAQHRREIYMYRDNTAYLSFSCTCAQVAPLHRVPCIVPHMMSSYVRKCLLKVWAHAEHYVVHTPLLVV